MVHAIPFITVASAVHRFFCTVFGRTRALLVLGAILLGASGCQGVDGQEIREWTFRAAHGERVVRIPVHLENDLGNRIERYQLAADITIDAGLLSDDVDLVIGYLPAAVSLRAGGAEVRPTEGADSETGARHIGLHRWMIPRSAIRAGRVSLELWVHHTWTQSAWLDVAPQIVPSGAVTSPMAMNRALNDRGAWYGLMALSQMGAAFLAIYFWDRHRRAYLWFGIEALAASYYPAYVLGYTTVLPPAAEFVILAQALSVATIVSVYFTHEFFGLGKPHWGWLVLLAFGVLVPVPALFPDFLDSAYGTPGAIICIAAVISYQVVRSVRLLFTYPDRGVAAFSLCAWLALAISAWVDVWAWMGGGEILDGARPACAGLALFGGFQAMLLSRNYVRSLKEADRLNSTLGGRLQELEARQAEIVALNEELRHQVGRRSAHILAALAGSDDPRHSVHLEPSDIVEDRYRIIGALGAGGMGTVYEVERLHDKRRLAMKVTHASRGPDLARLAREAQLAARVKHPNVVTIVDTDVTKAGYVYLVMELVEGCSLADREGQGDLPWCLRIFVQVVDGLAAIHAEGIIHRDLKPANVLLTGDVERRPAVKITDFGISRGLAFDDIGPAPSVPPPPSPPVAVASSAPTDATVRLSPNNTFRAPDVTEADISRARTPLRRQPDPGAQVTRTGTIAGTPSYVAPELARRGAPLTPAVDVFSFGVVAYRLLTGSPPHKEAPFLARIDGREAEVHSSFGVECPALPRKAAALLDACLAFSPEARPNMADLLEGLHEAADMTEPDLGEAPVVVG